MEKLQLVIGKMQQEVDRLTRTFIGKVIDPETVTESLVAMLKQRYGPYDFKVDVLKDEESLVLVPKNIWTVLAFIGIDPGSPSVSVVSDIEAEVKNVGKIRIEKEKGSVVFIPVKALKST